MRTFSKVLAVVLCVAMLFTTAFASGLEASFVDFRANDDNIIARVNLRNDGSANASGKIIVASYDENGNLVATGESLKTEVAKGAETIISASVASGADSYKAFVWNDAVNANSVHAVAGAQVKSDFVADTGVDNGLVSASAVATTGMTGSKPELKLYSPFKGRTEGDESEATGGRVTVSTYPANSKQYHEIYYADPSLEGLDFFVFSAGTIDYSANGSPLLTFDVVRDSEIMILATNDAMEFEGFDLVTAEDAAANGTSFAEGRYMGRYFADGLNAIGIRPTYAIAEAYKEDKEGFYEEVIKPAYDAASDSEKEAFDTNWANFNFGDSWTNPGSYIAMYKKTVTLDGADSAEVVIPAESTGNTSRNLIVLVKPISDVDTSGAFVPLTSAGNLNAVPALKGVEIDGAYVSIDKFTDNAYTYKLNPMSECVLPVVKGITVDNALYATTDYDIASDAKTAVATITVKNLYAGTSAVYTVNIAIDEAGIPEDAYDIVNLNEKTIVDNTLALKNKTIVEGVDASDCPIDAPVSMVSGKTYAQYIAYINEYYGYEEGDEGYITGTGSVAGSEVVATNSNFAFANDFAIGGNMGAEGTRRQISYVSPMYAFYKNLYRQYGTISLNQLSNTNVQGWFVGGLYFGCDKASTSGYNVNAKTDKLPPVPWFTAVMKEKGTVYVNSYSALPILEAKGYQLMPTTVEAYYGIDTKSNNAKVAGPTKVYYKVFEKGETVEIFNPANGSTSGHPPAWFFTTGTPDEVTLTYAKMSNGAAATSYNSTLTNGVLYKDLFADVTDSSLTSGNQWVSDFQPFGAGQRIKSIEDPSLLGCDYFTFSINNRSKFGTFPGTNILEFKVDKDCEVVILTKSADSAAVFGDFTKNTNHASITGMFPQNNYYMMVKALGIPAYDISIDMVNDFYSGSGYTFTQIYDKWLSAYFPGATAEELLDEVNAAAASTSLASSITEAGKEKLFDSVDSVSNVSGTDNSHPYTVSHTKSFKAGDTVAIPDPTGKSNFDRPIVVVVKPKITTTITDHVTDFQTVATGGSGYFILGPGANASVGASYSDRLTHDYITTNGYSTPSDASLFGVNVQRCFGVSDEVLGLENCYYLRMLNQTMPASWVGGNGAEDLAWMTFKVNQDCEVIVVPGSSTPNFVTVASNGWTRSTLDERAFTLTRHDGGKNYSDLSINATKTMYTKSFKAGDTVTLYNSNNGVTHSDYNKLPYFAFVRVK